MLISRALAHMSHPSGRVSTIKAIEVPSWGYHAYKELWSIETGEVLELKHEHNNEQDKNAFAVIRKGDVEHISRALANTKDGAGIVRHFLTKRGSKAYVKVVGKAVNRGGGHGMEAPSIYRFVGQKTNYDMLSKLLHIPNNLFYLLGLKVLNVVKNERQKRAAGIRSKNAIKQLKPDTDVTVANTLKKWS